MSKSLIVDYIPFEVTHQQINESINKNNGRLIVKGVLQKQATLEKNLERHTPILQTSMCVQYV